MNPNYQHLLVIRSIKDTDAAAFGAATVSSPQVVVVEFFDGRAVERVTLTALGIDAGHHVLDDSIFACSVHALEDEEHTPLISGIQHILQFGHADNSFLQEYCGMLFRAEFSGVSG